MTKDGEQVDSDKDKNAVVGVWASTERKRVQVAGSKSEDDGDGDWVQVSRLGNPLVNEVVIPLGLKDKFNSTQPADDAQYAKYVLQPELAKLFNDLFNLGVKETDRTDIELRVVAGALIGNDIALGDGPIENDKPFSSQFPYLPSTNSGFNSQIPK